MQDNLAEEVGFGDCEESDIEPQRRSEHSERRRWDSNPRSLAAYALQAYAIVHYATPPNLFFFLLFSQALSSFLACLNISLSRFDEIFLTAFE